MSEEPAESAERETDEVETDEVETDEVETDEVETDEVETDEVETDEVETDEPAVTGPSLQDLPAALESILIVVDEPVSEVVLAQVLEHPTEVILEHLGALANDYTAQDRGFELREVAGGWRLYSRSDFAPWVEKFVLDGQAAKMSQAALETLAVVAYRQPVSRGRVSAVRGVNVDGVMRTLLSRGLVEEVGSEHETGALLYGTTAYFLERLGLRSLEELPELAPYLPELDTLDLDSDHLDPIGSDA